MTGIKMQNKEYIDYVIFDVQVSEHSYLYH